VFFQRILLKIKRLGLSPKIEVVSEFLLEEDAHALEVELIFKYGRRDLGLGSLMNLTNGGEGVCGRILSKEELVKVALARKRGIEQYWADPTNYAKMVAHLKRRWKNLSGAKKKAWKDKVQIALNQYWGVEANKKNLANHNRIRWADKDYHERVGQQISVGVKKFFSTEEGILARKNLSGLIRKGTPGQKRLAEALLRPEVRAKASKRAKEISIKHLEAVRNDPKYRAKLSRSSKAAWADPEIRARRLRAILSPEAIAARAPKISKAAKERCKDPAVRARLLENFQNESARKKRAAATAATLKKRWAEDPEFRERMIAALKSGFRKKAAGL
jgi:hypothetical protein